MAAFTCVYFQTEAERAPVKEFIDSLHNRTKQKYLEVVGLLEVYGKSLPWPHADFLGDEIYELRFVGIEGKIRILYFFYYGHKIVFTNGFVKKRWKVPAKEIALAKSRKAAYERNNR